ncbi:FecR family protein [Rouxiella badensis]|uniref:FecR family protein n=1 Tax=Rahnella perminowiae TaxID=2816244 RepID=A0ABS6KVA1_9GAMM|nr:MULTISPECIES: FecR family protein [Yersiniaceae]MBU9809112.1 FecR family protein [Rahnella perminowiae]MBU9833529.1 FecR family protein [Rahnella perminowiae]MBU9848822.1 FecR family protein [Rahnella aceris]MBU9860207.1 FecR family protein [Rahnella aceris]MBU9864143.1 FecR family protein [Rahnella aceris]
MKPTQYPDPALQEAIKWMVLLRSGEATKDDYQQYKRWRYADAHHDAICAKIEATLGKIDSLTHTMPSENVRQTLLAPSSRRKFIYNTLGIAAMAMISGLVVNQKYPVPYLLSDIHTDTAQRRHIELGDGSTLDMNARTALNITLNDTLRNVDLRTGGIIVSVVNDTRPFSVNTGMGRVLTEKARFHVRQEDGGIHLAVLESVVKVTIRRGDSQWVEAGHGLWFNQDTLMPVAISPDAETAWIQGRLEVKDTPLSSVIASLKNYSSAIIRLDPAVANLRVSGNFPLDDVPYALDALAQTMPIAITRTTGYWIHVTSSVA